MTEQSKVITVNQKIRQINTKHQLLIKRLQALQKRLDKKYNEGDVFKNSQIK